jgi:cellulose synthase/poly-beta-1,6-N-acetylglucosamine synthase-like glycosyltransferase
MMSDAQLFSTVVFWFCASLVVYAYAGYPLVVWWLARRKGAPSWTAPREYGGAPRVAVVVAVHDEEKVISRRLDNLLSADYPRDRMEVVVASDGSTDATEAVVRRYVDRGVRLLTYSRRGKAATLNDAVAAIGRDDPGAEIVIFADARQTWAPDVVGRLVENFADLTVGAAGGDLVIQSAPGVLAGVGAYWRFEKWLRRQESDAGSAVSVSGAIWAARRRLIRPIPPGTILDDLYAPLAIAMQGYRIVHDARAVAYDQWPARVGDEFRRKVRTLSGNFQILALLPAAIVPWRNPVWLQFLSHKVARLLVPWALIVTFLISAALPGPVFAAAWWVQVVFYALGLAGLTRRIGGRLRVVTSAAGAFLVLNTAAWLAWWTWAAGWSGRSWVKVRYAGG